MLPRRGVTLMDLLVVLCATALLLTMVLAARRLADEQQNRAICASHLNQLMLAAMRYSNGEKQGEFPRTTFDVKTAEHPAAYTGANAANPWGKDGPAPNDVTAPLFLLMCTQDLQPNVFVCPSGNAKPWEGTVLEASNFDSAAHLGYSYRNPYPGAAPRQTGFGPIQR